MAATDAGGALAVRLDGARLHWAEPRGGLRSNLARDLLLGALTLGLWLAWVKVDLRRRVWGSVHLDGAPFRYLGTVREHLIPLVATLSVAIALAVGLWIAHLYAVPRPPISPSPWRLLVSIPLVFLIGARLWRTRADLLGRTEWRGLPGRLEGSPWPFARLHLATAIALPLTLGWIVPWRQQRAMTRLAGAATLAGMPLTVAPFRPLWGRFVVTWTGVIVVYLGVVLTLAFTVGPKIIWAVRAKAMPPFTLPELALIAALVLVAVLAIAALLAWHRIGGLRALAASTRIAGAPLQLGGSSAAFVHLAVSNALLRLVSLGLLSPHAEARQLAFLLSRLSLAGPPST